MKVSEMKKLLRRKDPSMNKKPSPIYVYPAVFTTETNGKYSIRFPDFTNCLTCGDNIEDGMLMAEDALALTIYSDFEEQEKSAPIASSITKIKIAKNEFVTYIKCDTTKYRRKFGTKSVKKTLSIPEWLNDAAVKENINFSQVLQEALKEKLNVS